MDRSDRKVRQERQELLDRLELQVLQDRRDRRDRKAGSGPWDLKAPKVCRVHRVTMLYGWPYANFTSG